MIFRLAFKDIVHDWLLSLCLVLAISAIIAPLLILFGLKFGAVETMRSRLVQDPKNREIRPLTTRSFSREWFDELRAHQAEVAFVAPMTRQISASVMATNAAGDLREPLSLMVTAPGDPLLLENSGVVPEPGECVLTEAAAKALNVAAGDQLTLGAQRIIQGRYENGTFPVRIAAVLGERASSLRAAYVRLEVVESVEDYKDGRAVPAYGWQGELPEAYPVFDGAVVLTPEPLSKLDEVLLVNNTGFSRVQPVAGDEARDKLGYAPEPGWSAYWITVRQRAATEDNLQAVVNKLRGRGAIVAPWIEPLEIGLTVAGASGPVTVQLRARSDVASSSGAVQAAGSTRPQRVIVVAPDLPLSEGPATLRLKVADRELQAPVLLHKGDVPGGQAQASAAVAGTFNLLRHRNVRYDSAADALLLSRQGYAGFRLYAATIDAVDAVQQRLEQQGVTVHTERERIAEVRRLDRYATLVFWLIAAVGVIGGVSALTASLYASVERKKKELNVLRLLGLLKRELVLFPISQGLLLSSGALALAAVLFLLVARVINTLFRAQLHAEESLCTLSLGHFLILAVGVWTLSVVAATFAALRATRLDPAEALRDE
ncbi:FtsX-like permease family protein [Desulfobulbus sp.]|uniref:FtsX-like permease family protein n=1 Tax=Desulfobulbus sp. TaxID=895 RepID=UPI0027B957DA|nr:FtsX-like permease family protein [Desulfobulbus sp.]